MRNRKKVVDIYVNLKKQEITLTGFELCVIRLVCNELTISQIAQSLHLDISLVENLVDHILAKIGAKNEVGIALFAWQNSLV